MEFFFTPDEDVSIGCCNLEMNCDVTALFNFQTEQMTGLAQTTKSDFDQITTAHSMPKIVDPEMEEPQTWTLEYRIPFSIIEKYVPTIRPNPGVIWRANFYKCADASSHPHWLTWLQVEYSRPNFHLPKYFGVLEFGSETGVKSKKKALKSGLSIRAVPDPFNNRATLRYTIDRPSKLNIDIVDRQGRKIKTVVDGHHEAGQFSVEFDASTLPIGIYICRTADGTSLVSKRMTLTK